MKTQNMHLHHPYNPMLGQHNLVYNAQFQPQPQAQFHHYNSYNPNIAHNYAFNNSPHYSHNGGYQAQIGVGTYWK